MKVSQILKGTVPVGIWYGRIALQIRFNNQVVSQDEIAVPQLVDKITDIYPRARYIVLDGDVPISSRDDQLFNLLQLFKTWYRTRGLVRVLLRVPGTVNLSSVILDKGTRSFMDFEIEWRRNSVISNLIGEEATLKETDSLFFEVGRQEDLDQVFHVLNTFLTQGLKGLVVTILVRNPEVYYKMCTKVLERNGLIEHFDILVMKA